MAVFDTRLLPLLEMLAELGMDWLMFELVDGIRRGDELAEDERSLAIVSHKIANLPTDEPERHLSTNSEPTPLLVDDQLQWAVEYVFGRLNSTLAEMSQSFQALDEILNGTEERKLVASGVDPLLVLFDDGEERVVRRAQVDSAQAHLPELRRALDDWRRTTQPESPSDQ